MKRRNPLNPATGLEDAGLLPWTNGNPGTGAEGSYPPHQLCTDVQEELAAVVEAAGITLDGNNLTQVLAAIQKLAGNTKPLYGVHALPAATMTVPNDVTTDITSFGTVTNGLLASTFSGGIFTVGTGDDGFYLLTDWLGTNLAVGTTGYGYAGTIGHSTDGGSTYTSIGGQTGYSNSNAVLGPFFGCSVVQKLNVGDKVKLSMKQNIGSSQNAPCGFGAIFLGK